MRFCPFCSAENADDAINCRGCARKLPLATRPRRTAHGTEADGQDEEREAPTLASIAPGPAALRRGPPTPQPRSPSELGRRQTDLVVEGSGRPGEPSRTTPPLPSRQTRDRQAASEASRSIPLPTPGTRNKPASIPPPTPARARRPSSGTPPSLPRPTRAPSALDDWAAAADHTIAEPIAPAEPLPPAAGAPRARPSRPSTAPSPEPTSTKTRVDHASIPELPEADIHDWATDANLVLEDARAQSNWDGDAAETRADSSWGGSADGPPPTRLRPLSNDDPKLANASVEPIPDAPDRGLFKAVGYAWSFFRARRQRNIVIKRLTSEIERQTSELDGVLGTLGKQIREHQIDNRVLAAENQAIDRAQERLRVAHEQAAELETRTADENAKFSELETEREIKVAEAEARVTEAVSKKNNYEGQHRALRDERKEIERRQKGYVKASEDRERQAAKADSPQAAAAMQKSSEELRRQAKALDPERQDVERRLAGLEKPLSKALAKVEALKADLDSARHALNDAREGHRRRMAEIEAEQGTRARELSAAEAEIERRMVTLGTLVNLHRVNHPSFTDLYSRIDVLRNAISARTSEIEHLNAERDEYDRGALIRGFVVIGCVVLGVLALVAILLAVN